MRRLCSDDRPPVAWGYGYTEPRAKLTPEEELWLAGFRREWFYDNPTHRQVGVRVEDPELAGDEFDGFEEGQDLWFEGAECRMMNGEDEPVAYGILPSERFYGQRD